MEKENMKGSLANARSPVRTHVERRVRLSDSFNRKLRPKGKAYSIGDSEVPGLRIYVEVSGTKTWYYAYKPDNEKNWARVKIGNFSILNVPQARDKAKRYAAAILDGKDPVIAKRELKDEMDCEELIRQFYRDRFNGNNGYKPKTIKDERLTEGPLLWKEGTKDCVFPSYQFGKKSSRGEKCTKPYFGSIRKTWARILKMANIDYVPSKQCRHTFLTLLLDKSKNIMVVKKAAGHTNVKTTERYAKILDKEVVSGLEKMDQVEEDESKVLEFKK